MNSLLAKLLDKRGIKNINELRVDNELREHGIKDELGQFEEWNRILSEDPITTDKIAQFCQAQLKIIENQWKNLDNSKEKNERLILLHTVYSTLKELISAPATEREQLEKYINQLLQS
jgi:glutamyl-tRNA reductase